MGIYALPKQMLQSISEKALRRYIADPRFARETAFSRLHKFDIHQAIYVLRYTPDDLRWRRTNSRRRNEKTPSVVVI